MKQRLILPIIVLALIAGVVGILFFLKARMPVALILIKESGKISYKLPQSESFVDATSEQTEIQSGTTVKTAEGIGHVLLPDNTLISLDSNTEIKVDYAPGAIDIFQIAGRTWHRVMNLGTGTYKVNTPTALATVRGTIFGVNTNTDTAVYVVESKVDIQQKLEDNTLSDPEAITEGKHAAVKMFLDKKGIDLTDITDEQKNSPWFKRNQQIDENKDQSREEIIRNIKIAVTERKTFEIQFRLEGAVTGQVTINELACQDPSKVVNYLNERISLLESKNILQKNKEALIAFRDTFVTSCGDGIITEEEVNALKEIISAMGTVQGVSTTIVPSSANTATTSQAGFQAEINQKLTYYTQVEGDGSTICSRYKSISVDYIKAELAEIEKKYNITPIAAAQFEKILLAIKNSCSDGVLSQDEMKQIMSSYPRSEQ